MDNAKERQTLRDLRGCLKITCFNRALSVATDALGSPSSGRRGAERSGSCRPAMSRDIAEEVDVAVAHRQRNRPACLPVGRQ